MTEPSRAAWLLSLPAEVRSCQGDRAGVVSRVLACAIDLTVVLTVLTGGYLGIAGLAFLSNPVSFRFPVPSRLLVVGVAAALMVLYLTISWAGGGRTYGDRVLGLRVVSRRGEQLHLGIAVLRAVFCTVLPIGLLWAAVDTNRRSVQDLLLRTTVIYDWSPHPSAG
ncbi:MAG: RDD family protein [Actinophytocola sp.]|uniref:RDD family protein n=1 Tax=Actinophytocola sp. TaxID=1872138 RepID=UPI003C74D40D